MWRASETGGGTKLRFLRVLSVVALSACAAFDAAHSQSTRQSLSADQIDSLGQALNNGTAGEADQAEQKLEEAAQNRDARASLVLGDYLAGSSRSAVDHGKAINYYTVSMEEGNVQAALRLGDAYREGRIVGRDAEKAFDAYGKAAVKGNSMARMRVAEATLNGVGTKKDIQLRVKCRNC